MTKEYSKDKLRQIPHKFKDSGSWQLSRKKFISSIFVAGFLSNLPSIKIAGNIIGGTDNLSGNQISIITSVQEILFPQDHTGPGAYDIMADKYLLWVLSDVRMDPEEIKYIVNGADWVDETAKENYSKSYLKLSQSEKETLIAQISQEDWGSSWLSVILTFIFEALLCDPQYGGNPEKIGWEWLNHNPGNPQPTEPLLYPNILKTVSNNTGL